MSALDIKRLWLLFGGVDEDQLFNGVDQPAHLRSMIEAVEDIGDDASNRLIGAENFDCPVRMRGKCIRDRPILISRNAFLGEYGNIRNDRAIAKGATQFRQG